VQIDLRRSVCFLPAARESAELQRSGRQLRLDVHPAMIRPGSGRRAVARLFLLRQSFLRNPFDQIDDASPHRLLLYLHECFCEGEAVCRREIVGHVGG
jgi:hypothetical protein